MRAAPIAVALVVVVAGCALAPSSSPGSTSSSRVGDPAAGAADNPWRRLPVRVAVVNDANDRSISTLVRTALDYWEGNPQELTSYEDLGFRLVDSVEAADLVVRYERSVDRCGSDYVERGVGCADTPGSNGFSGTATVRVEAGYDDQSVETIVRHEVGHTLGVDHRSTPEWMQAEYPLYPRPQPNLSARKVPWEERLVTVAVDGSSAPRDRREALRRGASEAVEFYTNGGVASDLDLRLVPDPDSADVVVDVRSLSDGAGSVSRSRRKNTDRDPAPEYYASATITLAADLDAETYGWHIAHWLAALLGAEDRPPELRADAGPETRRGGWR